MSQDTFPFAEADEDGAYVEQADTRRRNIMIGGGVAAALVVVAAGWFLFGGSGSSTDASVSFVPHGATHRVVAGPQAPAPHGASLPVAYTARLGRDPFKALYVVPAAAVGPAGTTPAGTTSSTVTPTGSGTTATGGPPATTTTPTTTQGSTTPTGTTPTGTTPTGTTPTSGRYTLKLVSISKPSPQARYTTWLVDGKSATVLPGQRFGKFGEIVVLAFSQNSAGTVTGAIIQVGDDSPLDVPVGQSVSVL